MTVTFEDIQRAAKGAVLEIAIETRGPEHADEVIAFLREQPYIAKMSQSGAGE